MNGSDTAGGPSSIICCRCQRSLELLPGKVSYLGSRFNYDLWQCPDCGMVLVPEELALCKMAEVERLLEDK